MSVPVEYYRAVRDDALMALARAEPLRYAFVSNSAEIGETIRSFIDSEVETLSVNLATMEAAVPIARELIASGTEVVIGGGGTGNLLAQTIGQGIVKLDRDPLDVLEALLKAREMSRAIALTSFAKKVDGVEVYERMLGVEITQVVFSSSVELSDGLAAAARSGCGVVVGAAVCRQVGADLGIPGVVVMPRESSVLQTLREARALALARRKERRDMQELQTILDTSRDGLIVLDMEGRVKFANKAAIDILRPLLSGPGSFTVEAELPSALLPTGIGKVLESGVAEFDRVRRIGPIDVVVSSAPIRVDGKTLGVVGTLREATRIQNIDRKVREKLYSKGFVARYSFSQIHGESPALTKVIEKARRFARSEAAVMIEGETGTGKELLAQSIHNASLRSERPFLAVNCSALSESLLESELFGYEEGAFTGARRGGKIGLFELAHGGTLFLDEVADVSPALQLRLLRVLEEKEIMRLGGDRMVPVDVRVISSSYRPLATGADGAFRRDLYFRLATLKLRIPPLRERISDIPLVLAALFSRHGVMAGRLSRRALSALGAHSWPGNLRELDSLVRTYAALAEPGDFSEPLFLEIFEEIRDSNVQAPAIEDSLDGEGLKERVKRFERETVLRTLRECGFDRAAAAKELGISLNSLWRKSRGLS